ncbi:hypothetical protein ACFC4M_18715, partial [Streptomyces sp. NPDC056019]|uniref:hypothetical protein n=1 Tax=Streptomyces sp. NPDC056019 TaxID=3345681 RepID=UPI0035DD0CFD
MRSAPGWEPQLMRPAPDAARAWRGPRPGGTARHRGARAGYDAPRLAFLLKDLPVQVLARMRSDRVLRRPAPP